MFFGDWRTKILLIIMKKFFYLTLISLIMISCFGIPKERKVTVSDVNISGIMKDFIKVVDGTYTFTNNGEEAFITIEFELTEQPYGESFPNLSNDISSSIELQVLDENGNYIELGTWGFSAEDTELEKLYELMHGKVGDKRRISFIMRFLRQNKNSKLVFTKASGIEIIDKAFKYGSEEYVNEYENILENSSENFNSNHNTNNNFDELLDDYEEYVDQYLKFYKKAADGDISMMSEYAGLMDKTQNLSERLGKAQGNMSSKQLKRYLDITNKFTTGIIDIAN